MVLLSRVAVCSPRSSAVAPLNLFPRQPRLGGWRLQR